MKALLGEPARLAAALIVAALMGLGIALAQGAWLAAALPLAAWLLLAHDPPEPSLVATRTIEPSLARAGEPVVVRIMIENRGPTLELLRLRDGLPPGAALEEGGGTGEGFSWAGPLEGGATLELRYAIRCPRGLFRYAELACELELPFWARRRSFALPCPGRVAVEPISLAPPALALAGGSVRPFSGISGVRRPGEGAEFHGTRDYSPGDRLRSLNWRAGALWGQAVVNVFEGERAVDLGVILDCRAEAYASAAQFEAACAASLALAEGFLDGANRVAYMRYGAELSWVPSGSGREQRRRIRRSASAAALGDHAAFERFDHLPISIFPPRSLVLFVSPVLRDDLRSLLSVKALGYELAVLRVNPDAEFAAFAAPGGPGAVAAGTLAAPGGLGVPGSSVAGNPAAPDEPGTPGGSAAPKSADSTDMQALAKRMARVEGELIVARLRRSGAIVLDWDGRKPLRNLRPIL